MANDLTVQNFQLPKDMQGAKPSALLANEKIETGNEGLTGGYGLLRYKGKTWTLSYKGEDYPFMRADGDGAMNSINVVIIKAAHTKSKTYFEKYDEGSKAKPICWSNNAITPAADVPKPVHSNCALCPMNVVGSKKTDDGKPTKACSDARRLAVALQPSFAKAVTGIDFFEPLLLRIPAGSLVDFGSFGDFLQHNGGWSFLDIVTKISFDPKAAFPKLMFNIAGRLKEEEVAAALELRHSPTTDRIVSEELVDEVAAAAPASNVVRLPAATKVTAPAPALAPGKPVQALQASDPAEEEVTEAEVVEVKVAPPAPKKTVVKKAAAAPPPPAEEAVEEELPEEQSTSFDDEIAAALKTLENK